MDGNPNVDAHTIRSTLDAQRQAVLARYQKELLQLASLLPMVKSCHCRGCCASVRWVGGDMDGNPNVDAHTIRSTLDAQRQAVLARYQ
ncbi:hypothetical protein C7E12_20505, partial [Stenotrophomonas maltophilia]